jgi:hypothetical protein
MRTQSRLLYRESSNAIKILSPWHATPTSRLKHAARGRPSLERPTRTPTDSPFLAGNALLWTSQVVACLDVLGKLVFPNDYKLNLQATIIAVQGELVMTASKPVDGTPQVKITMIGNDDTMTFTTIDANVNACAGVSTCDTGKKANVVAGGKVTRK